MFRVLVSLFLAVSLATAPAMASTTMDCAMGDMSDMSASPSMAKHMADEDDEMECCSEQCDFACSASVFLRHAGQDYAHYTSSSSITVAIRNMIESVTCDGLDPPPRA